MLAIGTVALDSIETPFGSVTGALGGSATYIGLAGRFFTPDVRLVAVVGGDFPPAYLDLLRERGLQLDGIRVDPDGKTFAWGGRYHYDLNKRDTLYTDLNVLATFEPEIPEAHRDSRIVCLGNLDPTIQRSVIDQVRNPELVICDSMNFWIEHTPDALRETLRHVDCLIVNDSEARELANEPNLIKAARVIRGMGPRILVIKRGEHGALLFADGTIFSAPAFPLEDINDPTGAGDSFLGGFAGYLGRQGRIDTDALKGAVIYGSAVASFAVESFGTDRLISLTRPEIDERVDSFRSLTQIPPVSLQESYVA